MIFPQIPHNEKERLDALLAYKILDSAPEKDFDDIVKLASEICHTAISTITLVDRDR
ncbi:MAG: histidine kinase, partial [Flavobacterium johnsoniae]